MFTQFTTNLQKYLSTQTDPALCAAYVAEQLGQLIKDPSWLEACHRTGCPNEPCANLVYVEPTGLFSVVSFVWQAGQQTCIHDHVCWCVVGVLEGTEKERAFQLMRNDGGETWLESQGEHMLQPGHVCQLVPPDNDIHQVSNGGSDTAISIHVYGTDIGKRGTSINRRFDELPVRDAKSNAPAGIPVNWRDVDAGVETGIQLA